MGGLFNPLFRQCLHFEVLLREKGTNAVFDPTSTIKGELKDCFTPKAFANSKLGKLGGEKLEELLEAAHDRVLPKISVPQLMGHIFFR